jgi:hypothetical protein
MRHARRRIPLGMKRRLLNLLTAGSLMLCVAAVALCVRGYVVADELCFVRGRYTYAVRSYLGGLQAVRWRERPFGNGGYSATAVYGERLCDDADSDGIRELAPYWSDRYPNARAWECGGFPASSGQLPIFGLGSGPVDPEEGRFAVLVVPWWFLAAVAGLLPAARLSLSIRHIRRRRRGLCPTRAYDLTANVSGVCPECGSIAAHKPGISQTAR